MTSLVVLVDTPTPEGGAAALLPTALEQGYAEQAPPTILRDLLERANGLGVGCVAVVVRRAWRHQVAARLEDDVDVIAYDRPAEALAAVARLLDESPGPVVIAHGEIMLHSGALADVVADPRIATGVLAGPEGGGKLEVREGRVVAAGSAVHRIEGGKHLGLGVLQVADADRPVLAGAARELAGLLQTHGWEADPLDLLVVGAVRRGLQVAAVPIAGYVWERPRTVAQADRTTRLLRTVDERKLRLDHVARPDDGFYSTFVVRRISRRVTEYAVGRGWTPNAITIASLVIGLVAAGCFATGQRIGLILGALLLQVSLVVDCVDGEVARFTRRFTAMGAWLDATSDRVKEYGVYAGLALGATRAGETAWTLAAATLALQVFRNFVDFGFVSVLAERKAAVRGERVPLDRTEPVVVPGARTKAKRPAAVTDAAAGPAPGAASGAGPAGPAAPGPAAAVPAAATPAGAGGESAAAGASGSRAGVALATAATLGRGAVLLSERTSRLPALKWAKRMVFLPIGERWLIISVGAAVSGARLVFTILLSLGVLSAVYATAGRVLRSMADS